jgi:hypothetical protein
MPNGQPQNWNLNVPGDPDLTPSVGDTVTINCQDQQGFTWCYSDTGDPQVFSDGFLANKSYDAGSYGPYTCKNAGTVTYEGVRGKDKPCDPNGGVTATMHSITVS